MANLYIPFCALLGQALLLPFACLAAARRLGLAGRYEIVRNYFMPLVLFLGTLYLYWHTPFVASMTIVEATHINFAAVAGSFRFAFPFIAALGVAGTAAIKDLRVRDEGLMAIAVMGAISSAAFGLEQSNTLYIAVFLPVLWAIWDTGVVKEGIQKWHRVPAVGRYIAVGAICLLLGVKGSYSLRGKREVSREDTYHGVPSYLETHVGHDEKIGYLFSHQSALFYGKNFNHEVLYVPTLASDALSIDQWVRSLHERHIKVLAVGPIPDSWGPLAANPILNYLNDPHSPFVRVFGDNLRQEPSFYRFKDSSRLVVTPDHR